MKRRFFFLTMLCLFATINSNAINAIPEKVTHKQPDGTTLELFIHGDEFLHWLETTDGFVIYPGNDNGLYYAITDEQGNLIPGPQLAHSESNRITAEKSYIQNLNKEIKFSKAQLELAKKTRAERMKSSKRGAFPTTGTNNLLMILVNFSDTSPTYTQSDFNDYMNLPGYLGIGSFKDYYFENSWGQLTMNTTVTAWVTVSNTHNYYGQNDPQGYDTYPRELVHEAITLVDPVVNFANFDNNNDGEVDGIAVIHQGPGEEASSNAYDIWSHSWNIAGLGASYNFLFDGVLVYDYTIQPEMLWGGMSTIGVMCHEFGHNLGAPDFYDTDYSGSGGQYDGTGDWDLMGGGGWNYNYPNPAGSQPAHHNIYTKIFYNWVSSNEITGPSTFSIPPIETTPTAYFYRTTTSNEYFLMENRVPSTSNFDAALPGQGMIIYHVDGDQINTCWNSNDINNAAHQGLYPKDAGGSGINTSGCPFPGTGFNTFFTDNSTPNSKSWANANTNMPITDITPSGNNINFNIAIPPPSGVTADTTGSFPGVMVSWAPPSGGQILNSQWLYYDTGSSFTNYSYGPGLYRYAVCFTPAQTSGYIQIDEFSLLTGKGNPPTSPTYLLDITQGSPDNPPIYSSVIPFYVKNTWSTLTLSGLPFDATQSLYFVITTTVNPSEYPLVIDNSTAVDGFGNLLNLGPGWTTWLAQTGWQGNWCMRAKVSVPGTTAKSSITKRLSSTKTKPDLLRKTTDNGNLMLLSGVEGIIPPHPADPQKSKNITGYQVVRNSNPPLVVGIAPPAQHFFMDSSPIPGSYTYSVYALYNEGTSTGANSTALNYPAALSLNAIPSAGGNVIGSGFFPYNSTVTLSATPAPGYEFVEWQYNGMPLSQSNPYSYTIITDMQVSGLFQLTTHTVALSASPTAGGNVSGGAVYTYGSTATCIATPNTGYNFDDWTEGATQVSTNPTYAFTVTDDRTLVANFSVSCPDNLHLNNITVTGSVPDYEATYNIYAAEGSATFVVQSPNGDVTFAAGSSIVLYPGFQAQSGSSFRAYIGGSCVTKEDSMMSQDEEICFSDCGHYRIYPNPSATGIFVLESMHNDDNRKIIEIYNFAGKLISSTEYSKLTHTTLNLSTQKRGIYMVRILSKESSETLKIIRQ